MNSICSQSISRPYILECEIKFQPYNFDDDSIFPGVQFVLDLVFSLRNPELHISINLYVFFKSDARMNLIIYIYLIGKFRTRLVQLSYVMESQDSFQFQLEKDPKSPYPLKSRKYLVIT